jgi:hypothetical protein
MALFIVNSHSLLPSGCQQSQYNYYAVTDQIKRLFLKGAGAGLPN